VREVFERVFTHLLHFSNLPLIHVLCLFRVKLGLDGRDREWEEQELVKDESKLRFGQEVEKFSFRKVVQSF